MDPRRAKILEEPTPKNGYFYKVKIEGSKFPEYMRGVGAPKHAKVGDRGILTYQTSSSFGLWFWEGE